MSWQRTLVLTMVCSVLAGCGGGGSDDVAAVGDVTPAGEATPDDPVDEDIVPDAAPDGEQPADAPVDGADDPGSIADPVDPPAAAAPVATLRQAITRGSGVASPAQGTFAGETATITIDSSFRPRVRTTGGVDRTFAGVDTEFGGLQAFVSGDESDFVMMTRPGSGIGESFVGGFDLTYTTFGLWAESNASFLIERDNPRIVDGGAFFAGVATPADRMPTAGTARFTGAAVALEASGLRGRDLLAGPLEATADFARGRLDASTELSSIDTLSSWGTVTMRNVAIEGSGFSGSASATSGHSGRATGSFMGPDADELGGAFVLTGPTTVRGSFAATR